MTDVLHLSARDIRGGAARATHRLHEALRAAGVDSRLLVGRKETDDDRVTGRTGLLGAALDIGRRQLDQLPVRRYRDRDPELFSPAWVPERRAQTIAAHDPDVVHLHWVAGGFLRPETVARFDVPVIWTCHDMWPFTGGCHYVKSCERYRERCGDCPHLGSDTTADLSRQVWKRKRVAFAAADLHPVAPSRWLADRADASTLFGDGAHPASVIPNALDTEFWRPRRRAIGRGRYGIRTDAAVVLFGADYDSPRKGADLLTAALSQLDGIDDLLTVTFGGNEGPAPAADTPYAVRHVGRIPDDGLRDLYAAADAVAVPSRQEAFGQTASEAMACGTPVVAFDATGLRDIVVHKETGYLATPFDPTDLAAGLRWTLTAGRNDRLGQAARERAVSRFDGATVAERYRWLYRSVR